MAHSMEERKTGPTEITRHYSNGLVFTWNTKTWRGSVTVRLGTMHDAGELYTYYTHAATSLEASTRELDFVYFYNAFGRLMDVPKFWNA